MQADTVSMKVEHLDGFTEVWHGVVYHSYDEDLRFQVAGDAGVHVYPRSEIRRAYAISQVSGKTVDTIYGLKPGDHSDAGDPARSTVTT